MPDREVLEPRGQMVPVWRLQWARLSDVKRWQSEGVPMFTQERLDKLIQGAYEAGWKEGEQAGRYNLRVGIENGALEPIRPAPAPDDTSEADASTATEKQ